MEDCLLCHYRLQFHVYHEIDLSNCVGAHFLAVHLRELKNKRKIQFVYLKVYASAY